MIDILRRQYGITVKAAASGDARGFDIVASTDDVDFCNEVLVQDWDLRRYALNPVVLYFHNMYGDDPEDTLPVGWADNVGVVDGKLKATIHFVDAKANELAEQCYQGFLQGSLRAVSVGFRSKLGRVEQRNGQDVFVLSGNELLEISVCPVPMNPNAVAERAKSLDVLRALVKSTTTQPSSSTSAHQSENGDMKILAKALGLKDDASEAEILSALNAVRDGAKSLESNVLEATGAKSFGEALGVIKAGVAASAELATVNKSLADAQANVEKRDREAIVAKGVADKKLSPALRNWALETVKSADGVESYKVSLETLKGFLDNAPTIAALASSSQKQGEKSAPTEQRPDGQKSWEELTPAEKHNLHAANEAEYAALKNDWERRGKPAPKYETPAPKRSGR